MRQGTTTSTACRFQNESIQPSTLSRLGWKNSESRVSFSPSISIPSAAAVASALLPSESGADETFWLACPFIRLLARLENDRLPCEDVFFPTPCLSLPPFPSPFPGLSSSPPRFKPEILANPSPSPSQSSFFSPPFTAFSPPLPLLPELSADQHAGPADLLLGTGSGKLVPRFAFAWWSFPSPLSCPFVFGFGFRFRLRLRLRLRLLLPLR